KTFDKEKEQLTFLYSSSNSNNSSFYTQSQNSANDDTLYSGSKGISTGIDHENNFSLDYTLPITQSFTLETGTKAVLSNITSDNNVYNQNTRNDEYVYNAGQSNALTYDRKVYAAYISG